MLDEEGDRPLGRWAMVYENHCWAGGSVMVYKNHRWVGGRWCTKAAVGQVRDGV
jgi:hypothetical protein